MSQSRTEPSQGEPPETSAEPQQPGSPSSVQRAQDEAWHGPLKPRPGREDDDAALLEQLQGTPWRHDALTAIRWLECLASDLPRVGASGRIAQDAFRIGQEPAMDFAPASISGFQPATESQPARLVQRFFGLFGPNGAMPLHLTELAMQRLLHHRDPTLARFADIMHHRMACLFYRSWASANPCPSHDRPDEDRYSVFLASAIGRGSPSFLNRDRMPDEAKLHYAGRFAHGPRNAEGLRDTLADFFQTPVRIQQFVGRWMKLPANNLLRLGESPSTGTVGRTTIVGRRIWECQQKFRIIMGPMGRRQYERLLPGGSLLGTLIDHVRNYVGDELTWDLNLVLAREAVKPIQLGQGARLGMTGWLVSRPPDSDRDELKLDPTLHDRTAQANPGAVN